VKHNITILKENILLRNFNIMKKLIFLLSFLGLMAGIHAQNTIRISGGTKLTMNGTVQFVLGAGNFINNGTVTAATGTLVFAGPVIFSGTGSTLVQNFTVSHSSGTSLLNAPISITNTATLMFGNLNANDNLLIRSDLSPTANVVIAGPPPAGEIEGLVSKASQTTGPCPSYTSNLTVNISGAQLRYQWQSSPDTITWTNISGATAHDYTATITGPVYYRCQVTAVSGTFTQDIAPIKLALDTPVATISGASTLQVGSTATLTGATAGGTWSSNNTAILTAGSGTGLITGISSGVATVTYTVNNSSGCTGRSTAVITVGSGNTTKPVVKITNPASVCAPGTVDLTVAAVTAGSDAGLTYTYYTNAAATIPVTSPAKIAVSGTYYIVGTNSSGISADPVSVVVTVTQVQNPKAAFSFNGYCINTPVLFSNASVVTGSGTVAYQWSDTKGNTSAVVSPSFTYLQTGSVSMKLRVNSVACPAFADSITQVLVIEQPLAAIRLATLSVVVTEPLNLQARTFGSAYTWTPATGLSNPNIANPTTILGPETEYKISIKTPANCVTVDTLLVKTFDKRIYVPNVFTPNGDGINDKLFVNLVGIKQFHYFRIYNRYSKQVFETNDPTTGWDGKLNNVLQPLDTYVWVAEAIDNFGNTVIRRGNVTLLR
jgi:gliding motility-associated-like protein